MDEPICRLCLKTILADFPLLEDDLRATLNHFLSKSVLNISQQQNMVCNECLINLQILYDFKRACADITEEALSVADCTSEVGTSLEGIKNKHIMPDRIACNFCTKTVEKLFFISLMELKNNTSLVNIPREHNPELNSNNMEKILSCESCHKSFQVLQSFITNCFNVEERVRKYGEVEGADPNGKIDLRKVQEFTFTPTSQQEIECYDALKMEYMNGDEEPFFIKSEPELKLESEEDPEPIIKYEEFIIKSEENETDEWRGNTEQQIPSYSDSLGTQILSCTECEFTSIHAKSIRRHMETHKDRSERKKYQCKECIYETITKKSFEHHMITHKDPSDTTVYKCEECNYETVHKRYLKQHILTHRMTLASDLPVYKCEMCPYETVQRKLLNLHIITHKDPSERKRYKCSNCAYESKTRFSLWRHTFTHKDPSEVIMYKCNVCTYETKLKAYLKQHVLIHKDREHRKKIKCTECPFEAITQPSMSCHKLTHMNPVDVPMHKCTLCTFQTKQNANLTRHMMTHKDPSERRRYKCKHCSFETISTSSLSRHTVIHRDPSTLPVHKCESCQYETIHIEHMKRHVLTHKNPSEREMYKCEYCSYEVLHSKSMQRHLVTHKDPLEVAMYKCELCTYETKHIADFKSHMKTKIHKDSVATGKGGELHEVHMVNSSKLNMIKCDACG